MSGSEPTSFALSRQQDLLWQRRANSPDGSGLFMQIAMPMASSVSTADVHSRVSSAVTRHEILRTTYATAIGRVVGVQHVHEHHSATIRESNEAIESILLEERAPFALDASPLRVVVVKPGTENAVIILTLSAFAADGASISALAAEIAGGVAVSDDPLQYVDYAAWQEDLFAAETAPTAGEFWAALGTGVVARLPFQVDATSEDPAAPYVARVPMNLAVLNANAQLLGVDAATVVASAWFAWLSRASRENEVTVAALFDGRTNDELAGAIGAFSRFAPVCVDVESDPTFEALVATVTQAIEAGAALQDFAPPTSESFPAFAAIAPAAGSLAFTTEIDRHPVELRWLGDRAELVVDSVAIRRDDADAFARSICTMLDTLTPTTPVSALRLLDDPKPEQHAFELAGANSYTELFEAQAMRTPERAAVGAGPNRMTYEALDARANQVARALCGLGVQGGSNVGLLVDRSTSLLVGILGILKAGGAYVPLNPEHPSARISYQLDETSAAVVVTVGELVSLVPAGYTALNLDDDETIDVERSSRFQLQRPIAGDDTAYVLYTSGSTGTPKGVVITHANLVNYSTFLAARLEAAAGVEPGSGLRCGAVSAISTDLGNTCIFPPLISGGCVELIAADIVVDPFRFAAHLVDYPIDVLKITPSHLGAIFGTVGADALPRKTLVVGGEASSWDLVGRIQAAAPDLVLMNHYGPTETTIGACTFDIGGDRSPGQPATVPIGQPIANTTCDVVDSILQPVPVGFPGELLIGGSGVAVGYIGQAALTDERFIAHPLRPGTRAYRTGDLVRKLPDGNIEFLGRIDDQLKIRGHRIEPGEIERVLLGCASLTQAAVVAREHSPGDLRLVAYVVAGGSLDVDVLRAAVSAKLPDYMAPSAYVSLDALPLTPSGKLDRRALPEPPAATDSSRTPYVAPRSETETLLAHAWAEVLGVEQVGVNDDFFALGGHSLLAMQVIARARHAVGIELPLHSLFVAPTVAGLADLVDELRSGIGGGSMSDDDADDELSALLEGMTDEEIARLLAED